MERKAEMTPSQREAVEHLDGPLLVLAGPGSGKTRVVTRRVARLIERGIDSRSILAITFTNRAAGEMADRVSGMLPNDPVFVSTFHRFCARLLRRHAEVVGLRPNYTILDQSDQIQLVRRILHDLNYDTIHYKPARVVARLSRAKNDLVCADEFAAEIARRPGPPIDAVVARVFPEYQHFDDLLLHVVELLTENDELRHLLDERYRYILVDEYQDTNLAQYRIVALLSQEFPNLCATGDPDQSIYGWRGARIDNILRFEQDFSGVRVVRLDQNFRSTKSIVQCADRLIAHNVRRKSRQLCTDNEQGNPVRLLRFPRSADEAAGIAAEIQRRVEAGERNWSDFAVFYRVNALSRQIEAAFLQYGVPFQVAAGLAFYKRAEVRDVLAYLRLIENPDDDPAFLRTVNTPARGIGRRTIDRLTSFALERRISLMEAAAQAAAIPDLTRRSAGALAKFAGLLAEIRQTDECVGDLLNTVVERSGYARQWDVEPDERDAERLANVQELATAADQYDETSGPEGSLQGFLETTSLVSDVDALEESGGCVTLMTLHTAKGLEFPVVFIVAVEQNLIPHERVVLTGQAAQLEEERRLLFVGITRAREELFFTATAKRTFRGSTRSTIASSFEPELDVDVREVAYQDFESDTRAEAEPGAFAARPPSADSNTNRPLLTTGADLVNGTKRGVDIPRGFGIGSQVRHPVYGRGIVVDVSGMSKDRNVIVEFEADGERRTFVAHRSPLQPVGLG